MEQNESRLEQMHESVGTFLKNRSKNLSENPFSHQPSETSLEVIAQMLIEINESLAIICDKMEDKNENINQDKR